MKFDAQVMSKVREALAKLPVRKFDAQLPKHLQKDPKEYARRMSRRAAVCVALCNVENEASLLLTLRSDVVGTHAGQVSFPGGHLDEGETAAQAALRELEEETKLKAQAIGCWHDVRAVTGTMVTPVLCLIERELSHDQVIGAARASEEVAETFSVRVEDLAREDVRSVEELRSRWTMPRFIVPEKQHPPIWGLTAFIIDGVMRDLLAKPLGIENYPSLL